MIVDSHPGLTSEAIDRLTAIYLANQDALFEARIADLGSGLTPVGKALREEREIRAEIAQETALSIRSGIGLFDRNVVADLAVTAGVDPALARDDQRVHDALTVAFARHNQDCADKLTPKTRPGFLARLFGGPDEIGTSSSSGSTASAGAKATGIVDVTSREKPSLDSPAKPHAESGAPACVPPAAEVSQTTTSSSCLPATSHSSANGVPTANQEMRGGSDGPIPMISYVDLSPTASSIPAAPGRPVWDGRMATIWDGFVDSMISTGRFKKSRKPELASTYRIITWIMGDDFSLAYAEEDELAEFKRRYLLLPKHYKTLRIDYENDSRLRSYDEVMEIVADLKVRGEATPLVKPKTFNKHKSTLSSALEWAKAHRTAGQPVINRIKPLHIKIARSSRAAKLERFMTPTNLLIALFKTPVWHGRANAYHLCQPGHLIIRDSLYWVPLMETGNGLRREEACQLRVRHIVNRSGNWCYDLLSPDIKVKTPDASPRLVAIQKQVLAAGFLEVLVFGRKPDALLFPELSDENAHEAFGEAFGKRIANYVANVDLDLSFLDEELSATIPAGVSDRAEVLRALKANLVAEYRKRFTNHGIRHWWKTTAINSGCSSTSVDDNLGHVGESRGEGGRYLKEIWVRNLKLTVDMVPMPFDGADLKRRAEASPATRLQLEGECPR